ncbi:MAG: 2-C-methyl-D-erythritol 4-phosphate cytidylyltransferase [Clostridiaceae bacterium]
MVSTIIVAAGSGKRMGKSINKVFLDLNGYPVLFHTIRAFEEHPEVDEIILVLKEEEMAYYQQYFTGFAFQKVRQLAAGGAERMNSVRNGLNCLGEDSELVLIHDGARPFVRSELITEGIEQARRWGAACPGVVPKDTIKRVDEEGLIYAELPRDQLRALQTPQVFRTAKLRELMERAFSKGMLYTDDTALFVEAGESVKIFPGDYHNLKITTAEDLELGLILMMDVD